MDNKAIEARKAYYKEWRAKNKDRIKKYNERYWSKISGDACDQSANIALTDEEKRRPRMDKYEQLQAAIEAVHKHGHMTEQEYATLYKAVKELQDKEVDDGK